MEELAGEVSREEGQSNGLSEATIQQDDVDAQGENDDDVQEVSAPEREYTADELEADLQNITNFFAVEPEGSDESLWVDLAKQVSLCTFLEEGGY